jgi:hypothetical protein
MIAKKPFITQFILFIVALMGVVMMSFKPSEFFGKPLTIKSGKVSGIEKQVEERSIGDPHDPVTKDMKTYTYIANFQLNGNPIVAKFQDPYQINEGDMLRVSGVETAQYFDVVAYRNETLQYTGSNSWWISGLVGISFASFAAFIFFRLMKDPQWYEQLFIIVMIGVGIFLVIRGFYIKEALDLLNEI